MTLETVVVYKAVVVTTLLLVLFLLERAFPQANKPVFLALSGKNELYRIARNLGLWLINTALSPLVIIPITLMAANHALQWRLEGWFNFIIDFLLLDCWIYWWHRANHRFPLLWRFHQIHHMDHWLDVTSAVRFHFGEVFISAIVRGGFIWLMGINWVSIIAFETLVLICAAFHHSNIKLPVGFEKALSNVIVTPSIHWVHHHAVRTDTDSNYATVLSVWDRLFGSFNANKRQTAWRLGIEGQQKSDQPLIKLIALPFEPLVD